MKRARTMKTGKRVKKERSDILTDCVSELAFQVRPMRARVRLSMLCQESWSVPSRIQASKGAVGCISGFRTLIQQSLQRVGVS